MSWWRAVFLAYSRMPTRTQPLPDTCLEGKCADSYCLCASSLKGYSGLWSKLSQTYPKYGLFMGNHLGRVFHLGWGVMNDTTHYTSYQWRGYPSYTYLIN